MKKYTFLFVVLFLSLTSLLHAQTEQLLVDENFQTWTNASATAATTIVAKTSLITNEPLNYSLWGITVTNTGWANAAAQTAAVASSGYLRMAKNTEITTGTMSIELSPLKSITKMWFVECATGSNRGFQVWKKNATDANWVSIHNAVANPAAGMAVNLTLNDVNVALKFTNLSLANYAFLSDLKIWGMVSGVAIPPVVNTISPIHNSSISTSGDVTVVYSENVTRGTGNITMGGVAIPETDIIINNATVTIHYAGLNTDSSYELVIPAGSFLNSIGTPTATDTKATYKTPDTIVPTLSKLSISNGATLPVNGFISIVMSEPCKAGSATISLGTKSITAGVSGSNSNLLYINYSGLAYDTDYTVTIPSNAITDLSENSYTGTSFTFHTEVDGKGTQLLGFTPDATTFPASSSGTVTQTVNGYAIDFGGVASAGARSSSPYTYSLKCNYVQLPQLPSIGELSFYIQCGGGSVPQEFYIQKLAADGVTWNTIETIILGTNDKNSIKTAAAQSSVPTTLRLMYNGVQFWFYNIDVYAYANNIPVDDGQIPVVSSTSPTALATDVVINGILKLTYSENVVLGNGNITLDGKTLSPSVIGKNITLAYANLKYATNYTLNIAAGAFKDLFNNPCDAFSLNFTTKAKPAVTPKLFNFVVALDGSGNGTTIQSAFDAVPMNNASNFIIFVKNGIYNEYPTLADTKNQVSLIGQSREGVVISGNRRSGTGGYSTSTCQTVEILADNFYCENITMQNTAGVDAGQAVALKVYGDKAVFKNVKLIGYQDTHLTSNAGTDRQYYLNCDIRGSVDFIFGNGVCFFDNCLIYIQDRSTANVICAPSTTTGNAYGYVFSNCTIDGASSQDGIYNLGRPWQNSPRAVYLNTKMNILASAGGWTNMSTIPALFAEYGTVNAANNPVVLSSRNTAFSYTDASSNIITGNSPTAVLTQSEASNYTLSNVVAGADAWDASLKPQTTASPSNLIVSSNNLSWNVVEGAISYIILKDGLVNTFTTATTIPVTNGLYDVIAVSEFGALSSNASIQISGLVSVLEVRNEILPSLKSNIIIESLNINHSELIESIDILSINGQTLKHFSGNISTISISDLNTGFYLINFHLSNNKQITTKVLKMKL